MQEGKLAIIGRVSAGNGITAEQEVIGYEHADNRYCNDGHFFLRVTGDSMQPRIEDGDLLLVRKQTSVDNGNIAVVMIDNEDGVVKRVNYGEDWIELQSLKDNEYVYYFQFLALTGLRPSEMLRLIDNDVKSGVLTVKKSKTEAGKRAFYLNEYAKEVLKKQKSLKKEKRVLTPLLFPNLLTVQECTIAALYKQWQYVKPLIKADCSMYALRHTFVSIGRQAVPEQFMKLLVGHTPNMSTYETYGHELSGDKQQAAALMQVSFDNVLKMR